METQHHNPLAPVSAEMADDTPEIPQHECPETGGCTVWNSMDVMPMPPAPPEGFPSTHADWDVQEDEPAEAPRSHPDWTPEDYAAGDFESDPEDESGDDPAQRFEAGEDDGDTPAHLPARLKEGTQSAARSRTSAVAWRGEVPDEDDPLLGFEPVPHVAPRRNSITADRQRAFIAELAACGVVSQAARAIGASMEALYKLRNRPGSDGFRLAWEEALDRGVARLEDCALARALSGEERPIVSGGKWIGSYTKHDNRLLMFLLRQRRSDRYSAGQNGLGNLRPGNPTYERIRREVLAQYEAETAASRALYLELEEEFSCEEEDDFESWEARMEDEEDGDWEDEEDDGPDREAPDWPEY